MELAAGGHQLLLELAIVLHDAVLNDHDLAGAVDVGVGIAS
jgi:hypothetical protein